MNSIFSKIYFHFYDNIKDYLISIYSFYLYLKRREYSNKNFDDKLYGPDCEDDIYRKDSHELFGQKSNALTRSYQIIMNSEFTDKSFVLKNFDLIKNDSEKYHILRTSGTSGQGLQFPVTKEFISLQWSLFNKQWKEFNLDNEWRFQFSGFNKYRQGKIHHIDYFGKKIFLSQYSLSNKNVHLYVNVLKKYSKIKWIHGYPSAVYNLFLNLENSGYASLINNISHVSLSSETVTDNFKVLLKRYLHLSVIELYGQTEGVANFFTCKYGKMHVHEFFSDVEFIQDGNESFRIIGSQYKNSAFPFYKYDTGDTIKNFYFGCKCGRKSRIVEGLVGRVDDCLVKIDNSKIGRLDHLTKGNVDIKMAQIYQKNKGSALFYVVADPCKHKDIKIFLFNSCNDYLGSDFKVDIIFVDTIAPELNGKVKFVKSELN